MIGKVLFTFSFVLHGRGREIDDARKILGRACFNSGFNVQDFTIHPQTSESHTVACVKIDKDPIVSKNVPENPEFVLVFEAGLDMRKVFKNVKNSTAIFNVSEKPSLALLKNNSIKAYYVDASDVDTASAMLGALAKQFNKLSIKSLKSAIEDEKIGSTDSMEEGHRRVK
jgi:Pyruvate/2-oxoacid:ferredoxin oxidoreductase gamma subunit